MAKKQRGRPRKQPVNTQAQSESPNTEIEDVGNAQPDLGDVSNAEPQLKSEPLMDPQPVASADRDYDPLTSEPVAEKSYAKPFETTGGPMPNVPEPTFTPPPANPVAESQKATLNETPLNSTLNDLPPEEKRKAAEHLADAILNGYEMLHKGARWYVQISDEKITDMAVSGEISPDFQIPLNDNGTKVITFAQYIHDFNSQASQALTVSDTFKQDVRPVLTRVLMKYGWGMTDEQYLMYMFGQDMAIKASIVIAFKKTINKTIEAFSNYYKQSKETRKAAPQPEQAQQTNASREEDSVPFVEVLEKEER